MANWDGHKPATSEVLLDLMTSATTGRERFSRAQRALFTACEFWAATKNQALASLLNDDTDAQLHRAQESFTAIGLPKTAEVLRAGRLRLKLVDKRVAPSQVAEDIEKSLVDIDEPVDEVLAAFASQQAQDRLAP